MAGIATTAETELATTEGGPTATTIANESDHLFSKRARRAGHLWIALTLPIAAVTGLFVDGQRPYLVAFFVIGALNVVPALVLSVVAWRRVAPMDRRFWKLFSIGLGGITAIGVLILVEALTGALTANVWRMVPGLVLLGVCVVAFFGSLFELIRSRSTITVHVLDVLESAMIVIAVCAFAPLLWGSRPIAVDTVWFTVPFFVATVAVLAGFCWSIAMFRRVRGKVMPDETLGLAIGFVCSVGTMGQTAQGLTGFRLPAAPLLVLQAACFAVLLMLPLHLMTNTPDAYDTLPDLEQARARSMDTIAIALLAPLLLATFVLQDERSWAVWYFVGVAIVLLMLATLRGKLAMRSTRRLYARVEEAAEARRQLLADVLKSADHDRHRVAAQLHQQATAFYVAFTSFLRVSDQDDASPSVRNMRDDLERQADELRELMLAVRPLETNESGSADLAATIAAYVDNLYVDTAPPEVDIRVDDELVLEWTTETIVMRILQEALRNVAKHAHASRVIVTIDAEEAGVAIRVLDDGVGYDPKHLVFESGNQYMRDFAAHVGGHVFIESEVGRGTSVRAVLGIAPARPASAAPATVPTAGRSRPGGSFGGRPHLVLVPDDGDARAADTDPTDTGTHARDPEELGGRDGMDPDGAATTEVGLPARVPMAGVRARLAQRRASSDGRRFFHFHTNPNEMAVKEVLQICAAAFLALPPALFVGFTLQSRVDTNAWMIASMTLFAAVIVSIGRDVRNYRRGEWDRFDPRRVLVQQLVCMLATGALGVATGGELAIFGPILIVILLIGVSVGSRPMITTLWVAANLVVLGVLAICRPDAPLSLWSAAFFAISSALIAGIVDLTVSKARAGLDALEAVADFTSFSCSVRDWNVDAELVLGKIAASVDATTVMVYERSANGSRQLREVARWPQVDALSPFAESDLRRLADRADIDGEFVTAPSTEGGGRLFAIAAATTSTEIVLAVELDRVGQRDDAALIAAVSSLASVIDRSGLIEDLLGEARTDPLTGLANRRQLQDYLRQAIGRSSRLEEPLSVAMIDLDRFKDYNDTWGHVAGDRVLEGFAAQLRRRLRAQDVAARYGGEEFCLLLPNTSAEDARLVLDELRLAFGASQTGGVDGEGVSFSAGVAQHVVTESGEQLIARADAALYHAKAGGRDRTECAADARPSRPRPASRS